MDAVERINRDCATMLGWKQHGASWQRTCDDGYVEVVSSLPEFTENIQATWQLVEYAAAKNVEYSLFMMIYDRHPLWMASFIKGMTQRTSTGNDPKIATCKAFIMMFHPSEDAKKLPY